MQTFLRTLKYILWNYNGHSAFHVDLKFCCLLKISIQLKLSNTLNTDLGAWLVVSSEREGIPTMLTAYMFSVSLTEFFLKHVDRLTV